jgi:hypothetical protein
MQHIVGGIQKDYKRLVHDFEKSNIVNFPSHKLELGENARDSSTIGCHDQSQHHYGMPIDTYSGQPQSLTHIGHKFVDLHMSGPSTRERGPSGPIFNELPRYASGPPQVTQALNHTDRPSAYPIGQYDTWTFEEDCYLNPHPSQQHFPSQYTCTSPLIQHPKPVGANTFRLHRKGRKGMVSLMNCIG